MAPVQPKTFWAVSSAPPNPGGGSAVLAEAVKPLWRTRFEACFELVETQRVSWRDGWSRRSGADEATEDVRGWAKRERLFQPKGAEGRRSPLHVR